MAVWGLSISGRKVGQFTGIALVTLLPFILLIKYHNRLFHQRLSGKRRQRSTGRNWLLDYDTSCFDGGEEFADPAHLYMLTTWTYSVRTAVPIHQPYLYRTGETPGWPTGWDSIIHKEGGYTGTPGCRTANLLPNRKFRQRPRIPGLHKARQPMKPS